MTWEVAVKQSPEKMRNRYIFFIISEDWFLTDIKISRKSEKPDN